MRNIHKILLGSILVFLGAALAATAQTTDKAGAAKLPYPPARRDSTVDTYFGVKVPAPYQWMENLDSPEVKKWVAQENALTFSYLDKIPVRSWMNKRLTRLWNYAKERTPDQVAGGRVFFSKNSGLQDQFVVYVQDSPKAAPQELLDPNALSPDGSIALMGYEPSPRGVYLAYYLSQGGSDWRTLHVREVATGKDLPDTIQWMKFSAVSWTEDGKGFFYSRYPAPPEGQAIRQQVTHHQLYYHRLGTGQGADKLIYARPDLPEWLIEGSVSEDGRCLFIYLENGTAPQNELFYMDLGDPQKPSVSGKIQPLYTKNDAKYWVVGLEGKTLFLQTDLDAPKGRIVAGALDQPDPAQWRVLVPEGEGAIQSSDMAGGRILVNYQVVAKSKLALFSTDGKPRGEISLPTPGSIADLSARDDSQTVYYGFTSFLYPGSVFRYNLKVGRSRVFFKPDAPFDPTPYDVKQVFYPSKDGTQIPMFIVARKNLPLDGSHPTILYGYGGFGAILSPWFNPVLPVWLELGGVFAVANLRGDGTYGEQSHQAGTLGKKQNVFDDFAWAAKYLVAGHYTSSRRLGIQGYSNGGLLAGASLTQNPDLFGAAYAGAGVLDMLRYQHFSGGALWAPEYGTSDDGKAFRWLYAYSPLANLREGACYPPTILTTADHDDRVVPSHSYQFAAALQHDQGCDNPVLIRVDTQTSHGYMPTDKLIAQIADVLAFEAYNMGIVNAPQTDPAGGPGR